MAIPRLKRTRTAERRKVSLAVKYRDKGKATGGGRQSLKKLRHKLEARNIPVRRRTE